MTEKNLKAELIAEMKRFGAYDVRIADPHRGYEHVLPGRHPLEFMPDCRSVIVYALTRNDLINHIYVAPRLSEPQTKSEFTGFEAMLQTDEPEIYLSYKIANLLAAMVAVKAFNLLNNSGFKAIYERDYKQNSANGTPIPCKLSAYEAGLSVYGKAGFTIHPELGNKMVLGVLLTDAKLEPDPKLENFDPCADCGDICIRVCPAHAYGKGINGPYHGIWSVDKCKPMRKKLMDSCYTLCSLCWDICPAGKYSHEKLGVMGIGDIGVFERVEGWLEEMRKRSPALPDMAKGFECIQKAAGVELDPELLDKMYK
ncbi:MAG: hypothetical protein GY795_03155 [Desulfobacterales bacterium]|nr:hypothetical protein [Desulfobacterales bacterium]